MTPASEDYPSALDTETWRMLFELGPSASVLLDRHLNVRAVSDQYLSATNTTRDAILGRHLFEIFPDNPELGATGAKNLRASLERVFRDGAADPMAAQRHDIRGPISEGGAYEERWWSQLNWPVLGPDGDLAFVIHRVEDISAYVQALGAAVVRSGHPIDRTAEVQAEILRRAQELQVVNEQLRDVSLAKNAFLSRMSHELRTPLTAVIGFGELLELADIEDEHAEWVSLILRASRHLLELMNAVLDISRVETGAMSLSLEPVSVAGSIAGVIDLLHSVAYASGHAIDTDLTDAANAYVLADQQRLRQVLTNLVSNALKYNRAGGRVDLRALRVGNRVRLEVADQGDGLSEGEMALLFVPFERLNAASHGIEGTGLGLALSKTLTETMGGKIGASSTPGEGSTFYVELAAIEPSTLDMTDATHHRLVASRDYERRFVLLYVDDVSANVRLVTEILKRRPMIELVSATSGVAALELSRQRPINLVLLDLHLPDIDGEEVLRRLRADTTTCDIPIVMLSADAVPNQVRRLLNLGAHRYLTKPVSVEALLGLVDEVLAQQS